MRNLKNVPDEQLAEQPTLRPIPRQRRFISEREFNRHIREAGKRQTTLTLRVARAMKYSPSDD